ncbi:cytochrome b5 domain-containing protein 1 [Anopheles bellator]|uniref:cytochrome b5 domain-containing protein 1 n=1 Tax=Anopheles bellator TaxID=139047 RepID=UPI002648C098|nr:cytochrome b5 domain-containing protein 1 [Anopheles bellator]
MESQIIKYYLPGEVVIHNEATSAWVSLYGLVLDITPLFTVALEKQPPLKKRLRWLLAFTGKDLSSFFAENPIAPTERTNRHGKRVPIFLPSLERNPITGRRWWRDRSLTIGRVTRFACPVKIINTLTFHATEMVVCCEDTVAVVRQKYAERYNAGAYQYEWRRDLRCGTEKGKLRLDKTLQGNGFFAEDYGTLPIIWIFYISPSDDDDDVVGDDCAPVDRCDDTGSFSGKRNPAGE